MKSVALPLATAVAGAAVGVLGDWALNRKGRSKRKLLGTPIPAIGPGAEKLARQVGQAAGQFGQAAGQFSRLASEVHAAREQVAKIGKALS